MYERTIALVWPRGMRDGRVIDGLVHAELPEHSFGRESLQVLACGPGLDHQRECRSVRRNYQVVRQSALQSEPWNAERPILVIAARVDHVVAGLGHPPGHAALVAVLDLATHGRTIGLLDQRVLIGRHDQLRHHVLEHRAAPRNQDWFAAGERQQASEREPGLLR